MDDVVQAWAELKAAARRFASLALDANHLARVEAIAHHEVEGLVRETADDWDDASRFRVLLTKFGIGMLVDFGKTLASKALRKYLRQP
jgi:uncharacterized protein (DUF736 family)